MSVYFFLAALNASLVASGPNEIDTRIIRSDAIYDINIAVNRPQLLKFPVPCNMAISPNEIIQYTSQPNDRMSVTVWANPYAEGLVTTAAVSCSKGVDVGLRLHVVERAEARFLSPIVNFLFTEQDGALVKQATKSAKEAAETECSESKKQLVEQHSRGRLRFAMDMSRRAFVQKSDREHGRNGYVSVHVDSQKQLGDFKIVEFRVRNGETGPIYLDAVAINGAGLFKQAQFRPQVADDSGASPADAGDPPDVQGYTSDLRLTPGQVGQGSIAFEWPDETSRFSLTVSLRAPEPREVIVNNIDF